MYVCDVSLFGMKNKQSPESFLEKKMLSQMNTEQYGKWSREPETILSDQINPCPLY